MPEKRKPSQRELDEAETLSEIRAAYHHLEDARYEFSRSWVPWQSGSHVGRGDLERVLRTIEQSAATMREKIAKLQERRVAE